MMAHPAAAAASMLRGEVNFKRQVVAAAYSAAFVGRDQEEAADHSYECISHWACLQQQTLHFK